MGNTSWAPWRRRCWKSTSGNKSSKWPQCKSTRKLCAWHKMLLLFERSFLLRNQPMFFFFKPNIDLHSEPTIPLDSEDSGSLKLCCTPSLQKVKSSRTVFLVLRTGWYQLTSVHWQGGKNLNYKLIHPISFSLCVYCEPDYSVCEAW